MRLAFKYKLLPHPYADEKSSYGETWARIKIHVIDDSGKLIKKVWDWQWDLRVILEWFVESENAILKDECPAPKTGFSIAQNIENFSAFYRGLDSEEAESEKMDAHSDTVFGYYNHHWIDHSFRGSRLKSKAIIGTLNGKITISRYDNRSKWRFDVDVDDFFKTIHEAWINLPKPIRINIYPEN